VCFESVFGGVFVEREGTCFSVHVLIIIANIRGGRKLNRLKLRIFKTLDFSLRTLLS
jgi:hypothetical protein